ncbi:hypothetical protein XA26_02790 [Mycolicibacterium fortuitum]|uniref:Uncharacterized protein n=1 Tax=Mycolicibacterium fortuitum TaxID=1766 RepID=A0A0N9Y089_MYCFO|nr:hypothetical protein XA26_02790 [Mycolicibacterium fortuitum]
MYPGGGGKTHSLRRFLYLPMSSCGQSSQNHRSRSVAMSSAR